MLLLAGAFALGLLLTRSQASPRAVVGERPAARALPPSAIEQVEEEVREELANAYYRAVDPAVLDAQSIGDMLDALHDPYTEYLDPEEYQSLRNRTARSYSGVGLTVGPGKEGLIVTSALAGPAREAGIRRGDLIVRIDGRPARKLSFERSLALIKGEEGTFVRLTVKRPNAGTMQFTVVRQEIAAPALRWRLIKVRKTGIGYLRLLSFPGSAAERLEQATTALVEKGAKALILDLRDNPGGLLGQAVRIVSLFLDEGVVCTIDGEHQERRVYEVSGTATYSGVPLAVLVDSGSASAAEIVAAALADHGRAVVVGERTYGKTSVQSVSLLSNGAALKLTTATYRTPSGADIIGIGLEPQLKALDDPLTRPDEAVVAAEKALLEQIH